MSSYSKVLYFIILLTTFHYSFAQRGSLGDLTVSTQNQIVNTYTYLTNNANLGQSSLTVVSNTLNGGVFISNLAQGDLLLIVQMQGAMMDINTTPIDWWGGTYTIPSSYFINNSLDNPEDWGEVYDYAEAGNYEFVEVLSVAGGSTINLTCPLTKWYVANRHVQVIRVPRFENLTVQNNASITCPEWDGNSGGVVVIEVNGTLSINGSGQIEASEKGFRGGVVDMVSSLNANPADFGYLGSFEAIEGSEKGEGIGGFYDLYDNFYQSRYCKGAPANGGGGANYHNAGGGGGSNVGTGNYYAYGVPNPGPSNAYAAAWNLENPNMLTQPSAGGGRGGYAHATANLNPLTTGPNNASWSGDARRNVGGFGGHPLTYDPTKIFMGGGGGAGEQNDGDGGNGGRGGGLVMLKVYGEITGNGTIAANGQNGFDAVGPTPPVFSAQRSGDDGAGGGGGGGAIHISNANPIPASVNLIARGGNGGNQNYQRGSLATANTMDGPGGGGAGGMIAFASGTPTQNVSGGAGGVTNSSIATNFPHNGATGGGQGMSGLSTEFYDLITEDEIVCSGTPTSTILTVTVEGTLPIGSNVQWYNNQYGGTSFHSGLTYNTPVIATNTTYWVGVCPGTFRIPVSVLISPPIDITGTAVMTPETCAGADGEITGLTATGGFGNLSFDWNGNPSSSEDLTNALGGSYTLTVTDENGCTETSGPHVVSTDINTTTDVSGLQIEGETCLENDGSITGITATGSGLTYQWNGNPSPTTDLIGAEAGTYTLTIMDDDMCVINLGPYVIADPVYTEVDDTGILISIESCNGNDGEITGITANGTGLTYEWNGTSSPTIDLSGAAAGNYSLTITNDIGCQTVMGPYTIGQATLPVIDDTGISITNVNCLGDNGAISGIVSSGTNLSFEWNGLPSPSIDLPVAPAGTYDLVVTDDNGCVASAGPYVIGTDSGPSIDDDNILISPETCGQADGSISGIVATGDNLTFEWNSVSSAGENLANAIAGTYTLTVTDDNGCSAVSGPYEVSLIGGPEIDATNMVVTPVSCDGDLGSIQGVIVVGAGLTMTYEWNGVATTSPNLIDIPAGEYTLIVTDDNGCFSTLGPVTVGQQSPLTVEASPSVSVIDPGGEVDLITDVTSDSPIDSVSWSPASGLSCTDCLTPTASPSQTTTYIVTVTNEDGCFDSDTVLIEIDFACGELFIPTIFSPNQDGMNDELCVLGGCIATIDFAVYNRWGERVFSTKDPTSCWDGIFRGQPASSGAYVYKAKGSRIDGTKFELSGNLTLVR